MAKEDNVLSMRPVTEEEAERECDSCDDTVDDSGVKMTARVDGREATWYLCEECFGDSQLDITERPAASTPAPTPTKN